MINPTPYRQVLLTQVSPKIADFLISENEDATRTTRPEYGTPHYDTQRYPNHVLVFIRPARDGEGKGSQGVMDEYIYAAKRESQTDYNWETTIADIGGVKFDAVTFTYVTLREEFDHETPFSGDAAPTTPWSSNYILSERVQKRIGDQELDSLFVVDQQTYIKRVTLTQMDFDDYTSESLKMTQRLYYTGETVTGPNITVDALFADQTNAYWGLQSTGVAREGRQLTANWYAITEREVVPAFMLTTGKTYNTTVNYSWPPVLDSIKFRTWVMLSGADRSYTYPMFEKEGYSGPCSASVVETWSLTPVAITTPTPMQPMPIVYNCPFFGLSVGACLHVEVIIQADTGNSDPVWDINSGSAQTYPATVPTDWPSTIVVSDEQKPFRGGYLRQRVTVNAPPVTPPTIP